MKAYTEFAPAKINLALHVLGRRNDGYHELDSIVAFADVGDVLKFDVSDRTSLTIDGPFATGLSTGPDNLVLKAVAAMGSVIALPPVHITLIKNLPIASGIGGGSADAAATLRGLLRHAKTQPSQKQLQSVALSLGADVPVCFHGKPCRMQGIGETITPVQSLPWNAIVLVNPLQACSTAEVFRHLGLAKGDQHGTALDLQRPEMWRNDLVPPALKTLPLILDVLTALKFENLLDPIRMSGSGATCFGLAATMEDAQKAAAVLAGNHPEWWVRAAKLLA